MYYRPLLAAHPPAPSSRYENTERRQAALAAKGLIEIGMGVSGGEEGARRGPAMMPGGDAEAYKFLQPIVEKVAAQTDDGPCVTYVGPGGASGGRLSGRLGGLGVN